MKMRVARQVATSHLAANYWDTHVHVFDSTIGPFSPSRSYTPDQATLQQLLDFSSNLTKSQPLNIVLVQPSPYRADNTVLLQLLRQLQDDDVTTSRGIAVVELNNTTDTELWAMHQLGVRGLRINMESDGLSTNVDALREVLNQTAERIKVLPGWKIQLFCAASVWDEISDTISTLPVELIADHLGGLHGSSKLANGIEPTQQPGFDSLVQLAKQSKVFIKISGLYRLSTLSDSGYDDMQPIVKTLAETVPDRLIWGTDWPHTGEGRDRVGGDLDTIEKFRQIDDEGIVENLWNWVGNEETWTKIMSTNPRMVYT